MKKIFLTMIALLCMTTAFAKNEAAAPEATNTDVKHMSYVLNDEQMSKYMAILNATIKNRGIIK